MAASAYLLYQTASALPIPYRPDARGSTSGARGVQAFERVGGIRWIVVHRELERGRGDVARIEALLQAWFGPPSEVGTHAWWDVRARSSDVGTVP